ncbi:MAG: flagellar hook-basal body complex protein FliE [Bacteroidetes bacterium]|nr:flagellar hook-basal body complex protein FliE [Bacteroidota bacterium]
MKIEGLGELIPNPIQPQKIKVSGADNFGSTLTGFINDVNQSQQDSQKAVKDFVSGNGVELHDVMIAGEKAKTNLELLMEIRNKAIDMFKELTRMPV